MKHARKLLSMLVALATIFALLGLSGCSTNTTDYYETVLNLKQFTDMPDIEYRQVLNKYMDDLHGTYSGSDGNYTVTVKGNITSLQQVLWISAVGTVHWLYDIFSWNSAEKRFFL